MCTCRDTSGHGTLYIIRETEGRYLDEKMYNAIGYQASGGGARWWRCDDEKISLIDPDKVHALLLILFIHVASGSGQAVTGVLPFLPEMQWTLEPTR